MGTKGVLRPASWVLSFFVVTSLGGDRLAAQDEGISDVGVEAVSPPTPRHVASPAIPDQRQPKVLNRGPLHEAFAEPVSMQLSIGLVAPEEPPPNIEEVPPENRPQGQEFAWIPGYWSWDVDRHGYIWVGACWRAAPPGMAWMPGYWFQAPHGWRWIAGFWAPAEAREIEYLPAPPMVTDMDPPRSAPSPDTIWIPPCMYWIRGQYLQRPGYWLAAQPDWVWTPSHYLWTPRGYVFAEGHWDYSLERRGVLFAPVSFETSDYRRLGYTYSPSIVINLGSPEISLFAYPRYGHYYFGDYYDESYLRIGIYPWFDGRRLHLWDDPVYEHNRWSHQQSDPRWEEHERSEYRRRHDDQALRPAWTYREQKARLAKLPESQRLALQVTQPFTVAVANRKSRLTFERTEADARPQLSRHATAVRTFRDQRKRWESPTKNQEALTPPRTERVTIPAPPVVGKPGATGTSPKDPPPRPTDENKDPANKDLRT